MVTRSHPLRAAGPLAQGVGQSAQGRERGGKRRPVVRAEPGQVFAEERLATGAPVAQLPDTCGGRVQQRGTPVSGVLLPSQQSFGDEVVHQGADRVGRETEAVCGRRDPDAGLGGHQPQQLGVRPAQPGGAHATPQASPGEPLYTGQESGELIREITRRHLSILALYTR